MNDQKEFLLLLFCLSCSLINAQVDETILDSIPTVIDLDDVVVTAQYAPTASQNAGHSIKVIKSEDIQKEGQNNLAEVLSNQLNLRVSTDPVLGNGLRIQGIGGENVQVMIDGVPVIGRLNGNIDLSQINLHNIQRIEIVEGALSAQYGSNASGGVINLITKKSQLNKYKITTQSQYESIGIFNNAVNMGMNLGKLYAGFTLNRNVSSFADVDSLRLYKEVELANGETINTKVNPWNPKTQKGVDGTLKYRFNDSTNLTYQYRFFNERLSSYGEIRRPRFQPYSLDEFFLTERIDHSFQLESYLGKHFYLKSTTAYNQFERLKETQRLDIEADTSSLLRGGQDTTSFTAFLHRSVLSTTHASPWNAQLGMEVLSETGRGQRIVDSASLPINKSILDNYALWGSVKYKHNNLSFQTNLRYGYNTKYKHPLIPSVHVKWTPSKAWLIQWSYAHGFRSPSLKELYFNFIDINHYIVGNTKLKAEHSKNTSLTATYTKPISSQEKLRLTGKLFYNYLRDRIVIAEFEPFKFNYQNLDQFKTHGLNAQFDYEWDKRLRFRSGLSYTRLSNYWSENSESDKFTGLYEMQNRLSVQIPITRTNVVLTHRYIGKQVQFYQDAQEQIQKGFIGSHQLFNGTISQSLWEKRIFLALGIKNIFDIQGVSVTSQGDSTHSRVGNSQLLNWGRTCFIRLNLSIHIPRLPSNSLD